jgi:hypothetical protein
VNGPNRSQGNKRDFDRLNVEMKWIALSKIPRYAVLDTVYYTITRTLAAVSSLHLTREHWIAISVVMVALGFFFMRGFGSRTGY